jgi:hypothetical protein
MVKIEGKEQKWWTIGRGMVGLKERKSFLGIKPRTSR